MRTRGLDYSSALEAAYLQILVSHDQHLSFEDTKILRRLQQECF